MGPFPASLRFRKTPGAMLFALRRTSLSHVSRRHESRIAMRVGMSDSTHQPSRAASRSSKAEPLPVSARAGGAGDVAASLAVRKRSSMRSSMP